MEQANAVPSNACITQESPCFLCEGPDAKYRRHGEHMLSVAVRMISVSVVNAGGAQERPQMICK